MPLVCFSLPIDLYSVGNAYYAVHFCNGISLLQFTKKSSDKNVHWQFPILALVHSFRTLTDTSTWNFEITVEKKWTKNPELHLAKMGEIKVVVTTQL